MRPNVVLIVLDAARADHFEPYGAPQGSTPCVADLARSGRHVPHAYAAASWTVPSHAALFSGLLPRDAGLSKAPAGTPQSCRPRLEALHGRLLASVLQRNGYETRGLTANAWLTGGSGFETGFDGFRVVRPERDPAGAAPGRRGAARAAWEAWRARVDDGAGSCAAVLREWAAEPREKPFFWFVNLVEAHSPYLPPRPFNPLGPLERVRAAGDARRFSTLEAMWRASLGLLELPGDTLERMRRLYRASIRALDAWLGELLATLDGAGALDDTLLIVTADHGENLGEQGMLGHAFSLDERLLRVPFVAHGPVALGEDRLLSLASLPCWIAERIGLADHPWERTERGGFALAQFDPPTRPGDPRNEVARERWSADDGALARMTRRLTAATDGAKKLVRGDDGSEWVYDLVADPLEERPLRFGRDDPAYRELRAVLASAERERPSPGAEPGETAPSEAEARDLEERMRLLGYL